MGIELAMGCGMRAAVITDVAEGVVVTSAVTMKWEPIL